MDGATLQSFANKRGGLLVYAAKEGWTRIGVKQSSLMLQSQETDAW
jgi:hypothetical protein